MNKVITSFLLLILFDTTASAQRHNATIGFQGGPSISSLYGNEILYADHGYLLTFSAGASIEKPFHRNLSLITGLNFQRKGSKALFTYDNPGTTDVIIIHLDYLVFPFLLRWSSMGHKERRFFLNAGPYIGLLQKTKEEAYEKDSGKLIYSSSTSLLNKFDMGLSTGIGCISPINRQVSFSVELRNDLGLTNLATGPVYNDGSVKTISFDLLFGFNFSLR